MQATVNRSFDDDEALDMAALLHDARTQGRPTAQLTRTAPAMTLADAEAVQRLGFGLRQDEGETLVGWKMGLTSFAKMAQVGVHSPIRGRLGSATRVADGATLRLDGFCHPRIEPEVAFIMGRDVDGDVSASEAMAAVALIVPALEIIDSRYRDFQFALADVIADNSSSARFVLGGPGVRPDALRFGGGAGGGGRVSLDNLGMIFEIDGVVVDTASSAAILDGPEHALAALCASLAAEGEMLRRGDIVLAGAATAAVPLAGKRHVRVSVEALGSVSVRIAASR